LDDEKAVREALGLPSDTPVPSPTKVAYPKTALNELITLAGLGDVREALAKIAEFVDQERCIHASETGFREFLTEVTAELGDATSASTTV
jgi:hypothetical protein